MEKCISAILEQEPPQNLKKCLASAILEQEPSQNLKMLGFLGAVNASCLMWPKYTHLLKPLSDKSCKKSFVGCQKWTERAEWLLSVFLGLG